MADAAELRGGVGRMTMRWGGLAAAALLLAGCGFHLRGAAVLPKGVDRIHVQAANPDLTDELTLFLQDGGAKVLPSAKGADAVLAVNDERFDRRVLTVDPKTGKAREYQLSYSLNFALRGKNGTMLVAPQQVKLDRDYVFDADQVLGSSAQESTLRTEMRRDAVQQILRRLEAALHK